MVQSCASAVHINICYIELMISGRDQHLENHVGHKYSLWLLLLELIADQLGYLKHQLISTGCGITGGPNVAHNTA